MWLPGAAPAYTTTMRGGGGPQPQVVDESGQEFNLGQEKFALPPVVGGAHAMRKVAVCCAGRVVAQDSSEIAFGDEFGRRDVHDVLHEVPLPAVQISFSLHQLRTRRVGTGHVHRIRGHVPRIRGPAAFYRQSCRHAASCYIFPATTKLVGCNLTPCALNVIDRSVRCSAGLFSVVAAACSIVAHAACSCVRCPGHHLLLASAHALGAPYLRETLPHFGCITNGGCKSLLLPRRLLLPLPIHVRRVGGGGNLDKCALS